MTNLESSSLAGSAPSEQEVHWLVRYLDQAGQEYGVHVRNAESQQAATHYASYRDALYWLRTALPGLLATARDERALRNRLAALLMAVKHEAEEGTGFAAFAAEASALLSELMPARVQAAIETALREDKSAAARSTGSVD